MLQYKSPIYYSFLIAIVNLIFISFALIAGDLPTKNVLTYSVLSFILIWIFTFSIIEILINKNIKNLYKLVLKTKTDKREDLITKNILPPKTLSAVEKDIKEWAKTHQNELEFYKKLSHFKKDFLQNLSHEIRTPLFSIQAYSENLQSDLKEKKTNLKQAQNDINVILRNIDRLNNLIRDIEEINKLENNSVQINLSYFNLEHLIQEVLEEFKFLIQTHQNIIHIKWLNNKTIVYADKEKIKQVIINLLENAIKYNLRGTKISFNVDNIDDKTLSFEISDNGKGIAEIHLDRLFERFYRVDPNRSRELGGTGLGLAICKHIMELHNSFIHVRSKVNVGTSFSIGLKKEE